MGFSAAGGTTKLQYELKSIFICEIANPFTLPSIVLTAKSVEILAIYCYVLSVLLLFLPDSYGRLFFPGIVKAELGSTS